MYISGKKTPTATTALDDGTMLDILLLGRSKLSTYYLLIVSVSQEKAVLQLRAWRSGIWTYSKLSWQVFR